MSPVCENALLLFKRGELSLGILGDVRLLAPSSSSKTMCLLLLLILRLFFWLTAPSDRLGTCSPHAWYLSRYAARRLWVWFCRSKSPQWPVVLRDDGRIHIEHLTFSFKLWALEQSDSRPSRRILSRRQWVRSSRWPLRTAHCSSLMRCFQAKLIHVDPCVAWTALSWATSGGMGVSTSPRGDRLWVNCESLFDFCYFSFARKGRGSDLSGCTCSKNGSDTHHRRWCFEAAERTCASRAH